MMRTVVNAQGVDGLGMAGTMDTPAERLRWARDRAGYAGAKEAADAFGFNYSNYSGHENGGRNPSRTNAQRYAKAYKVRWEWLLFGLGEPSEEVKPQRPVTCVPVISWVKAGPLASNEAVLETAALRHVEVAGLPPGDWAAFEIDGDSMDRIAPNNSIIIVDRRDKVLRNERLYVIATDAGEATFKRYRSGPDRLQPFSTNPDHETILLSGDESVFGRVRLVLTNLK